MFDVFAFAGFSPSIARRRGGQFAHQFIARSFDLFPGAENHQAFVFQNGKLPRAVVRPPLVKVTDAEIERIKAAITAAGLLSKDRSMSLVA